MCYIMGLELLQLVGYISLNEVISELELAIGLYPALCVCVSFFFPWPPAATFFFWRQVSVAKVKGWLRHGVVFKNPGRVDD